MEIENREEDNGETDSYSGCSGRDGESLAERRNVFSLSINTTPSKAANSFGSPSRGKLPCLTIPAGISPTALLDSPIMISNSQALPSPTTGTFPLALPSHENRLLSSVAPEIEGVAVDYQVLLSADFSKDAAPTEQSVTETSIDVEVLRNINFHSSCADEQISCPDTVVAEDQISLRKELNHGQDVRMHNLLEGERRRTCPPVGMVKTSEDGYNWRKYGQKQVKGSEYPRCYYKCTHPNCQVKKKIERSHDGQITEIIYKGYHSHPKPQSNRRPVLGSSVHFNETSEVNDGGRTSVEVEGGSILKNVKSSLSDVKLTSGRRPDGVERTSTASAVIELSDPLSTTEGKVVALPDSAETPQLFTTFSSHYDDYDDGAALGSISPEADGDDDEPDSKRRKKENCLVESNLSSRAVREPRVVVQVETEVDILDDGYRWRKYGQKVVKGNPNPRSYYKCTSPGCSVRKHVERASSNLKFVITTYEGKHNHEVPAARNNSHVNSGGGHLPPIIGTQSLPRNSNIPKPESQIQDLSPHFDSKPKFHNGLLRPGFVGNFCDDLKYKGPTIYPLKFSHMQSTIPYGSFGPTPINCATHPTGSAGPLPDFLLSLPLSNPTPANYSLAGFDFNSGKPVTQVQPFVSGQQLKENDLTFLRPKEEPRDGNPYDNCLSAHNKPNAASSPSSSVYGPLMGHFPS